MKNKESPAELREKIRMKELEKPSYVPFGDGLRKSQIGNLSDLTGLIHFKVFAVLLLVLFVLVLFLLAI